MIFFSVLFSTGIFFVLPCTDSFVKVDMRTISFDIPPQEVEFMQTNSTKPHRGNAHSQFEFQPVGPVLKLCLPLRSWPRTQSQCLWTEWCTSGSVTPSPLWPMCPMLTLPPVCWHKPPSETFWAPRTWLRSCLTVRASLTACRYRIQSPFKARKPRKLNHFSH